MPLRFLPRILLASLLLTALSTSNARDRAPSTVQDLQYGEVLFHFYQDDYFGSLVHLLKAEEQNTLDFHRDEAELLQGGISLSYGLTDTASQIFTDLLVQDSRKTDVRNRAWYSLAKISFQQGDTENALKSLNQIEIDKTNRLNPAAAHLFGLVLMDLDRQNEAISLLSDAKAGRTWSPYLDYNLGLAQIKGGYHAAGEKNLAGINKLPGNTREQQLLRDKANLALGFNHLKNGKPDQSGKYLKKVRLEGPLSNKALLGSGWASAEAGKYGKALIPWMELGKRSTTDPAVQEALLAVPYAMTQMSLHGRAVQEYTHAIDTLSLEKRLLDESITAIRMGNLLDSLNGMLFEQDSGWLAQLNTLSDSPALHYQTELMASHPFQEGIKNYRDLLSLEQNLQAWSRSIPAYEEMLKGRETRFIKHQSAANNALSGTRLDKLQKRTRALQEKLTLIENDQNSLGLATGSELHHLATLERIDRRLNSLPKTSRVVTLKEKAKRYRGMLIWNVDQQYKQRLWKERQSLAELKLLFNKSQNAHAALQEADHKGTSGFKGFQQKINTQRTRISEMLARTSKTRHVQGAHVEQLAINELEAQKKRLDVYVIQARYALAQTYDRALNTYSEPIVGVVQ